MRRNSILAVLLSSLLLLGVGCGNGNGNRGHQMADEGLDEIFSSDEEALLMLAGIIANNTTISPAGVSVLLQNLVLDQGTLDPVFLSERSGYRVDLTCDVTSLKVTPIPIDSRAEIRLNGTLILGGETYLISLNEAVEYIQLDLKADGDTRNTYVVTVLRSGCI